MNTLYLSQQEALHSVESHYFPRYETSNTWGKYICNIIHDSLHTISMVKTYFFEIAKSVSNAAFAVFNQFVPAEAAYDFVCPVNIVNGERHIVILPRTWEKFLGDNLLFPLSTWGLSRTHAASEGETLQITVDRVVGTLLRPDENQALLNPTLAPIAFFDNLEWGVQTLTNCALSCVEDVSPDEAPKGFEYKMEVMKHPFINAFSVPGGKMVVFSGLIEEIDNSLQNHTIKESKVTFKDGSVATVNLEGVKREDVLAALIGHEMTHAASRHLTTFSFDSFINELMNLLGGYSEDSWSYFLLSSLASRKNEFECDVTGAYLASKAGYDPRGAIYLEELFLQSQPAQVQRLDRLVEPLFSHPHGSKRLRAVFTAISTFAPESLAKYTKWKEPQARHPYDLFHLSPALKAAEKVQENLGSGMFIV
jgi:hypothetical protein